MESEIRIALNCIQRRLDNIENYCEGLISRVKVLERNSKNEEKP